MIYSKEQIVSTLLCDEDDQLTIWGLARLFQDIAGEQSDELGVGFKGLQPNHKAWVLTRVYYKVLRYPMADEKIIINTWPRPDDGLIAPRDYQLFDEHGNLCAVSSSNWVILNMDTRRVCRLMDVMNRFEEEDKLSTERSKLDKIIMPDNLQEIKKIDIPYSALDHTRHVNNAEYMKWINDSIEPVCKPRSSGRPEIREFDIAYLRETKYNDSETIMLGCRNENELFYQIKNSTGIAVNAKVIIG